MVQSRPSKIFRKEGYQTDHVLEDLNEIVLPLLNVSRPMTNNLLNPKEPHQVQIWISSPSEKNTFCYDKTIELMEQSIISPSKTFIMGCSFRVPMKCGLLPKDFLNELKLSPTFSESSFAKEYLSRFVGSSSDAWFNYERILKHRRIINPEIKASFKEGVNSYYILAVDIARLRCQTVAVVLKVFPDAGFKCKLVNLFVLGIVEEEKVLDRQAIALKELIEKFNPKEVVIDINGLGVFFADAMIRTTFDEKTGKLYPAYGFFNRPEFEGIQPRNASKILYGIKANPQINSDMHSYLYSKIDTGKIDFLISEKEAKTRLMATKAGQKMPMEKRVERLMAYDLTTKLIDEIMNLRTKPTGANKLITVEQINKRMTKDKFSALEMGIYRITQIESEELSHQYNRGLSSHKLTFFRNGGRKFK